MADTSSLMQNHPLPPHFTLQPLIFALNRKRITLSPYDQRIPYDWTLLEYLREHAHLPGTKLGCGEGGCGACTVVMLRAKSQVVIEQEQVNGIGNGLPYEIKAINACLMPLVAVHGAQIITIGKSLVEHVRKLTTKTLRRASGHHPIHMLYNSALHFCSDRSVDFVHRVS